MKLHYVITSWIALITLSITWNISLRNNNTLLTEEVKAWKAGCYSACSAYNELDRQIASGLCLPLLKEMK